MPTILPFRGVFPRIHPTAFVANNATLIGDVEVAEGASIWFGAVLRGDVGPIRIGAHSNVQDLVAVHATGGLSEVHVGDQVTVGHGCILHGCRIGNRVLVGMGSILLDNAIVGDDAVIGAGSLLTARMQVPAKFLAMGRPAKILRETTEQERRLGVDGAANYTALIQVYGAVDPAGS